MGRLAGSSHEFMDRGRNANRSWKCAERFAIFAAIVDRFALVLDPCVRFQPLARHPDADVQLAFHSTSKQKPLQENRSSEAAASKGSVIRSQIDETAHSTHF
jgi:hypothetical protein